MKNFKTLTLLFLSLFVFLSCEDNEEDNSNNSNNLISQYSGVLVGSTGYYNIDLKESNSTATVVFDGVTHNLTTTENLTIGQSISNFSLSNSSVSLTISASANGSNPSVSFTIPGHNIVATIYQKSNNISDELYLGNTESKDENGLLTQKTTINIHIHGNEFSSYERVTYNPENPGDVGTTNQFNGQVSKSNQTYTFTGDFEASPLILNISGNTLTASESDMYGSFDVLLTKTN